MGTVADRQAQGRARPHRGADGPGLDPLQHPDALRVDGPSRCDDVHSDRVVGRAKRKAAGTDRTLTVPGATCRVPCAVLGATCSVRCQVLCAECDIRAPALGTWHRTWHPAPCTAPGTTPQPPSTVRVSPASPSSPHPS